MNYCNSMHLCYEVVTMLPDFCVEGNVVKNAGNYS
jgi:hypothetical protein